MKKLATLLVSSLALAACQDSPNAPRAATEGLVLAQGGNRIEGSYIVVLKDEVDDAEAAMEDIAGRKAKKAKHVYKAAIKGGAIDLSEEEALDVAADPRVAYVEEDQVYTADATQSGATWGIDRIDQRSRPLSGTYTYTTTASTVYAYIIDTGLRTDHAQFGGRAANVYDAIGDGRNGADCNGHGTHVGGTVGGSTYGVAKAVRLRGLRVLNCSGSGSTSGIIAGIDWVRLNRTNPAVANLSLGGGYSSSLNTAVTNLANSGVFVAVAAGNSNANACNYSPASAAAVTTVASSTNTDAKSSFSNYGSCVDLYAPGSSITSAWYTTSTATNTISGTSMASPHVAGVAALYKATYGNASQSTIDSWLKSNATANVITGNPTGTPNRLLYKGTL